MGGQQHRTALHPLPQQGDAGLYGSRVHTGKGQEIREYPVSELKFKLRRKNDKVQINDKELKELEELERKEGQSHITDE